LRNKLKDTKENVNNIKERPYITCHLGGDDLQLGGLVSVTQVKRIEKLENIQSEKQKLPTFQ
jgi:hypothetical protein